MNWNKKMVKMNLYGNGYGSNVILVNPTDFNDGKYPDPFKWGGGLVVPNESVAPSHVVFGRVLFERLDEVIVDKNDPSLVHFKFSIGCFTPGQTAIFNAGRLVFKYVVSDPNPKG